MKSVNLELLLQPSSQTQVLTIKEVMVKLRNFVSKRCTNNDNIDDIVQETFSRIFSKSDLSSIDNIYSYSCQVAKSVMYSDWQKSLKQPDSVQEIEQYTSESNSPESQMINQRTILLIHQVLADMPTLRKKVFQLRRIDGLSREDISRTLDISEESVKKHITRAMLTITQQVEHYQ